MPCDGKSFWANNVGKIWGAESAEKIGENSSENLPPFPLPAIAG